MNKNFHDFNLQRFNDGVVQPTEDTTASQQPTDPAAQGEQQPDLSPNGGDSGNDFEFVLDEQGNLTIVEKSATGEPAQNEADSQQQPEFYTPEQINEIGLDKLDPNKLPPEILPFYKQMQADYTRKTQDLANKNKDLDTRIAELNQPQQQQQPPVEQPDPAKAQRQYYEEVYKIAKTNIEKYLGEQFDELNPLHVAAMSDEVASIKAYVVQTQMQQQQIANVMNQYVHDPEWKEIEKYTENVLNNLPYQQSTIIRQRLQSGDIDFLNQFLAVSKSEYLKTKNGVPPVPQVNAQQQQPKPSAQPPRVESAGAGVATSPAQNFNYKSLGKMTNDELANAFVNLGLTKM